MNLYQIKSSSGEIIGRYFLDPFPACPKIAVSHGLEIFPEYRRHGYGTQAQRDRQKLAILLGYDVLLATVKVGNIAEEKILSRSGWRQVTNFFNTASDHDVGLWMCNLKDPYKDWIGPCR